MPGEKNVVNPPLVLPENIFLPLLHIKLCLMKNFVNGMDKNRPWIRIFEEEVPRCE